MQENPQEINLDAPVAGMSLTSELGARPWQKPPQYNTVDEVSEFYVSKLSTDEASMQVVDVLEMGVPVSKLANILQLGNVMEGIHSIDVGVLVTPVIMEMIQLIGDQHNISYSVEPENNAKEQETLVNKAMLDFRNELGNSSDSPVVEKLPEVIEEPMPEPASSGLMSRRV